MAIQWLFDDYPMTIRWLSDDYPMTIQWLSWTFDLFFLMIIDLKRSIDRRWPIKSSATFILRWSCFSSLCTTCFKHRALRMTLQSEREIILQYKVKKDWLLATVQKCFVLVKWASLYLWMWEQTQWLYKALLPNLPLANLCKCKSDNDKF